MSSACPLRNVTSTPESSGESHGTFTVTRTAQRMSFAHPVPIVPSGVELVSRATYISRKKRNRETCWRQSKALKRVQREARRKLVAQPEISHEAAEVFLRNQAARTVEKFLGIIQVSHQLALLHGHKNVCFCTQCGAVNAGGSLRLLKSLCGGSGESGQKARRKLERGLMPKRTCCGRCEARTWSANSFSLTLLDALTHRELSISSVIKKKNASFDGLLRASVAPLSAATCRTTPGGKPPRGSPVALPAFAASRIMCHPLDSTMVDDFGTAFGTRASRS